jgi:hypothetical protein
MSNIQRLMSNFHRNAKYVTLLSNQTAAKG